MKEPYNSSIVNLHPILQGSKQFSLTADELSRYKEDAASGIFRIELTVGFMGFRCNADEFNKLLLAGNDSMEAPWKHKIKGTRRFLLKGITLPHGTGKWVDVNWNRRAWMVSVYSFIICIILCSFFYVTFSNVPRTVFFHMLMSLGAVPVCIVLLIWEVRVADRLSIKASNAALGDFMFDPADGSLAYGLSTAIVIGPNKKNTGIYFDELEVVASYRGRNFSSFSLPSPSYLQGRQKNGGRQLIFNSEVKGKSAIVLVEQEYNRYREDQESGCFPINFRLSYKGSRLILLAIHCKGRRFKEWLNSSANFPRFATSEMENEGLCFA